MEKHIAINCSGERQGGEGKKRVRGGGGREGVNKSQKIASGE